MMMFVYTMSISSQTAFSTSTRRLATHTVPALTIHPREIQTLCSHNHDTGSYDTSYEVYSSSNDVVIYWTMTGTHAVPDSPRMMSIHQIHLAKHHSWCKYFVSNRSYNKHSQNSTVYQVDNSNNDVVIYYDRRTRCTG